MHFDQITTTILVGMICGWCLCAILAAFIGSTKSAGTAGFFYGCLLGPVGLAMACKLDRRPICGSCHRRIEFSDYICPYCGD